MEPRKVAIIGDGAVGSSIAYTLMLGHGVNEIVIVDVNRDKAEGDALDMKDGNSFLSVPKNLYSGDYKDVANSHIIIITAGAAQKPGETRLDLLKKNASILSSVCDSIKPYIEEDTIVLVVSNPVDILSYLAYRRLGIPSRQVIGSGTVLDTSRLKVAISNDTGIDPRSIHTFVVGEHGDSEVPLWSATTIGGLSLTDFCLKSKTCNKEPRRLKQMHEEVKNSAYKIIEKKGATFYAVAMAVSRIVSCILNDENSVLTVSTYVKEDFHGSINEVYLSLPSVVNSHGVRDVLEPEYSEEEKDALIASGRALRAKLEEIGL